MTQQAALPLSFDLNFDDHDFLIHNGNQQACQLLSTPWQYYAAMISGDPYSGKTYLLKLWTHHHNAFYCAFHDAITLTADELIGKYNAIAIDDIPPALDHQQSVWIYHLLNLAKDAQKLILLSSQTPTGRLQANLADAQSRLHALPTCHIAPPDDAAISSLLLKLLSDRQLDISPNIIDWITRHMPRSYKAIHHIVMRLDTLSLERKRPITLGLAKDALTYVH